jgi:hypothetical protein
VLTVHTPEQYGTPRLIQAFTEPPGSDGDAWLVNAQHIRDFCASHPHGVERRSRSGGIRQDQQTRLDCSKRLHTQKLGRFGGSHYAASRRF